MEIIYKEIAKPKLTISTSRVSVKLPIDNTTEENSKILKVFEDIIQDVKDNNVSLKFTLRGYYHANKAIILFVGKDRIFVHRYEGHLNQKEPITEIQ